MREAVKGRLKQQSPPMRIGPCMAMVSNMLRRMMLSLVGKNWRNQPTHHMLPRPLVPGTNALLKQSGLDKVWSNLEYSQN